MATRREIVTLVLSGDNTGLYKSLSAAEKETVTRSRAIVSGVAAIGTVAIAAGAKFTAMATEINAGMSEVSTLIPGQTERIVELRSAVQDLSVEYGTKTDGLVGGLYQGISAWGDTADTIKILEINVRAAKAGVAETSEAIGLTSAVTKGYGDTNAAAVKHVADLAFKTVELGQTTFPELAASIGDVVPLAVELGVTQEEMFAVMATGTGVTGNTAKVATQYKGILAAMLKPTGDLTDLYEELGVETGKQLIEQRGMQGALDAIAEAARRTGIPLTKYLGRVEATTLGLALTGAQSDTLTRKTQAMETQIDASGVAFKVMTEGINASSFALDRHKQQAIVWGQKIGQSIIDFSGPLATGLLGLAQFGGSISLMAPKITALMVTMGGWSGVMGIVGGAAKVMWLSVMGPVGIVIGVLAAVGVGLYAFREKLGLTKGTADETGRSLTAAKERVAEFQEQIDGASQSELPALRSALAEARQEIEDWKSPLQEAAEKVAFFEAKLASMSNKRMLSVVQRQLAEAREELERHQQAYDDLIPQIAMADRQFEILGVTVIDVAGEYKELGKASTEAAEKVAEAAEKKLAAERSWAQGQFEIHYEMGLTSRAYFAEQKVAIEKSAADRRALQSRELNEMYERQYEFRAEAAKTTARLKQEAAERLANARTWLTDLGKSVKGMADRIPDHFIDAFKGGGGFVGGLKAVLVDGFSIGLDAVKGTFGGWIKGLFSGSGGGGGLAGKLIGGITGLFTSATPVLASSALNIGTMMGGTMGATAATTTGTSLLGGLGAVAAAIPGWGWAAAGIGAALFFFKGWGGPSKAEQEARAIFGGFHDGVVESLGGTQRFADEVQVAINNGWGRTLAETRAGFILMGTDMGKTYDQAFRDYERYQQAVGEGNTALMKQIEDEYAESATHATALWEGASQSAIGAFRAAKEAGVRAYDETLKKAVDSGLGQEEAVAQATAAQLDASAEVLAAKGIEYSRIAAFQAAMALGAKATEAERSAAAREAATVAIDSWEAAMNVVVAADQAATDAIKDNSAETAEQAAQTTVDIATAYQMLNREIDDSMSPVTNLLDKTFKARTIKVRYDIPDLDLPDFGTGSYRPDFMQHGGAVLPGRAYVVGERRPELFVPGEHGTILPRVPRSGGVGPIDITLQIDGRTLNAELIRVHENTLDFYGQ